MPPGCSRGYSRPAVRLSESHRSSRGDRWITCGCGDLGAGGGDRIQRRGQYGWVGQRDGEVDGSGTAVGESSCPRGVDSGLFFELCCCGGGDAVQIYSDRPAVQLTGNLDEGIPASRQVREQPKELNIRRSPPTAAKDHGHHGVDAAVRAGVVSM